MVRRPSPRRRVLVAEVMRTYLDQQNALATLDLVAMLQKRISDFASVYESAIRGTQISEKATGRVYLKQTMVSGKEAIIRQAQVGVVGSPYQESIVLVEGEYAAFVRTSQNS